MPRATAAWPIPVSAAVLVAAIGIVAASVDRNGNRIDAIHERITAVETRLSGEIANVSERLHAARPCSRNACPRAGKAL